MAPTTNPTYRQYLKSLGINITSDIIAKQHKKSVTRNLANSLKVQNNKLSHQKFSHTEIIVLFLMIMNSIMAFRKNLNYSLKYKTSIPAMPKHIAKYYLAIKMVSIMDVVLAMMYKLSLVLTSSVIFVTTMISYLHLRIMWLPQRKTLSKNQKQLTVRLLVELTVRQLAISGTKRVF